MVCGHLVSRKAKSAKNVLVVWLDYTPRTGIYHRIRGEILKVVILRPATSFRPRTKRFASFAFQVASKGATRARVDATFGSLLLCSTPTLDFRLSVSLFDRSISRVSSQTPRTKEN